MNGSRTTCPIAQPCKLDGKPLAIKRRRHFSGALLGGVEKRPAAGRHAAADQNPIRAENGRPTGNADAQPPTALAEKAAADSSWTGQLGNLGHVGRLSGLK